MQSSNWTRRQIQCRLKDEPSCPRSVPGRLTAVEIQSIKTLVQNPDYAHYSILSLSLLAKRIGAVFSSPSSWARVIQFYGLKRTRMREYPPKPKIGIRASTPNLIWHLDTSIIRLKDQSRVFIQSIIDNYSRYVLAWAVTADYGGIRTRELLLKALLKAKELGHENIPTVMVDSGSENLNESVDALIQANQIRRLIAQIEINASNSMVEMLFHRLKNRHLYFVALNKLEDVKAAVDFYLNESNQNIPHAVLRGATPTEVFSGQWISWNLEALKDQQSTARQDRMAANRSLKCEPCPA
jgi:putative transposase